MDAILASAFVAQHNLGYTAYPGHIIICGQMSCLGDIVITVEKLLAVLEGDPQEAPLDTTVQTIMYSYNASVRGHNSFLRYDNCHRHRGHTDDHHRHIMDWKNEREAMGSPEWVGEDGWPHLSQFVDFVDDWYRENGSQLPAPQAIPALDEPYVPRLFTDIK